MKTMGISKFKTHALKILDQVAKTQEIEVSGNPYLTAVSIGPIPSSPKIAAARLHDYNPT